MQPARPIYTARPGEAVRVFRDPDGSFVIGAGRITLAPDDTRFVGRVVTDLGQLVHTAAGEAALQQGDAFGRRLRVEKPNPPADPPNAWTLPDDLAAACATGAALGRGADGRPRHGTGTGCGSTIVYDPADWPRPGHSDSPTSVEVLLLLLRQANLNAAGRSDPSKPDWGAGETEE